MISQEIIKLHWFLICKLNVLVAKHSPFCITTDTVDSLLLNLLYQTIVYYEAFTSLLVEYKFCFEMSHKERMVLKLLNGICNKTDGFARNLTF